MSSIRTILVATDFTNIADHALSYAVDLAKLVGAKYITVIHVYDVPTYHYPDGTMVPVSDVSGKIAEAARATLEHVCAAHASEHVRVTPCLRQGAIAGEVATVAREIDADLIVVGTHGRKGVELAALGSAADKILRGTKRPVLVVRPPEEQPHHAA